jgi:hypothetical protein
VRGSRWPLEFYGRPVVRRTMRRPGIIPAKPAKIHPRFNRLFSAFFNTLATNRA